MEENTVGYDERYLFAPWVPFRKYLVNGEVEVAAGRGRVFEHDPHTSRTLALSSLQARVLRGLPIVIISITIFTKVSDSSLLSGNPASSQFSKPSFED